MKIFFDFDGPILDVICRYYKVFSDISDSKNLITMAKLWALKRQGQSWETILKTYKLPISKNEFYKLWIRRVELKKYLILDKIQPQAKENLRRLRAKYPLYLISLRRSKLNLLWQLEELSLNKYFKKIIYCPDASIRPWQAKAAKIKKILKPKESAVIVGDTEVDIRAGKLAGIKSIGVTCGIRNRRSLIDENPDYLIPSIKTISKIIK